MRLEFVLKVVWKELLSTWRDSRTLRATILLPLIMNPLILLGLPLLIGNTRSGEAEKRQIVGVIGLERMPLELKKLLESDSSDGKGVMLKTVTDATKSVQDGEVEASLVLTKALPTQAGGSSVPIEVHVKLSSQKSQVVLGKINNAIEVFANQLVTKKLASLGLSEKTLHPVVAQTISADTVAEKASGIFAFFIPLLLLQAILGGGQSTAIDSTAGEKERGSLEALLVTPISRFEVVVGKAFSVTVFSLLAATLSVLSLLVTGFLSKNVLPMFMKSGSEIAALFGGSIALDAQGYVILLLISLTIAAMLSALMLNICIYAKSFKEAQTYLVPLTLVISFGSIGLQFADFLQRTTALYLIPLIGSMISILDLVKGKSDLGNALIVVMTNLVFTAVFVALALRSFRREQVLFRN
jgi:sodium transport system permease protein